jgi:DNA repair exonuclease SbcCD ATPase subunit
MLEKEKALNSTLLESYQTRQAEYVTIEDKLQYDEFWVRGFSRSGVVSLLLDQITPELNHRANEYLDVLTGGKAWVEFSTKTTLSNGEQREKFSVIVNYDNGAGMYGGISGGEMRRVDIAILLALGDVAASRAHAPVRFRLFDEPFDNLDALGKERVVALLQEKIVPKVGTLLVMSHDEELKAMFDQRIVVEKHNGVSSLRALEVSA